ncbi:hypothetical protein CHS0354_012072 [Potamilus streckersoni]|uniref:Uncharacterized protein n=1 Tax=Potamilus streckersoni TaxID=2493646 RepID=A0AAE0S9X1_9BIVA|nr:hypothetical protein CHS0354_012072 [Potamilus streckersoni]
MKQSRRLKTDQRFSRNKSLCRQRPELGNSSHRKEYSTKNNEVKNSARKDQWELANLRQMQRMMRKKMSHGIPTTFNGNYQEVKDNTSRFACGEDGNILSKPTEQLVRYKEHFKSCPGATYGRSIHHVIWRGPGQQHMSHYQRRGTWDNDLPREWRKINIVKTPK